MTDDDRDLRPDEAPPVEQPDDPEQDVPDVQTDEVEGE